MHTPNSTLSFFKKKPFVLLVLFLIAIFVAELVSTIYKYVAPLDRTSIVVMSPCAQEVLSAYAQQNKSISRSELDRVEKRCANLRAALAQIEAQPECVKKVAHTWQSQGAVILNGDLVAIQTKCSGN